MDVCGVAGEGGEGGLEDVGCGRDGRGAEEEGSVWWGGGRGEVGGGVEEDCWGRHGVACVWLKLGFNVFGVNWGVWGVWGVRDVEGAVLYFTGGGKKGGKTVVVGP